VSVLVSLLCHPPPLYDLYAQSPCIDQRKDHCHYSSHSHVVCSFCESFNHEPRFVAMIETMNGQHMHFVSEMRECGLSHETDPSPPFPKG